MADWASEASSERDLSEFIQSAQITARKPTGGGPASAGTGAATDE